MRKRLGLVLLLLLACGVLGGCVARGQYDLVFMPEELATMGVRGVEGKGTPEGAVPTGAVVRRVVLIPVQK